MDAIFPPSLNPGLLRLEGKTVYRDRVVTLPNLTLWTLEGIRDLASLRQLKSPSSSGMGQLGYWFRQTGQLQLSTGTSPLVILLL